MALVRGTILQREHRSNGNAALMMLEVVQCRQTTPM
jgi:hypothetical protein